MSNSPKHIFGKDKNACTNLSRKSVPGHTEKYQKVIQDFLDQMKKAFNHVNISLTVYKSIPLVNDLQNLK